MFPSAARLSIATASLSSISSWLAENGASVICRLPTYTVTGKSNPLYTVSVEVLAATLPKPSTAPTMTPATSSRANAGTRPSAVWNRSHRPRRVWRLRSCPGNKTGYCAGGRLGAHAAAGTLCARTCCATSSSTCSNCSRVALASPLSAAAVLFTQPSITRIQSLMLSLLASGSLNSSSIAGHDATSNLEHKV